MLADYDDTWLLLLTTRRMKEGVLPAYILPNGELIYRMGSTRYWSTTDSMGTWARRNGFEFPVGGKTDEMLRKVLPAYLKYLGGRDAG